MQTGLYRCGVPAMEGKYWEKLVIFSFRSRNVDQRFREDSRLLANLMGIFYILEKVAGWH